LKQTLYSNKLSSKHLSQVALYTKTSQLTTALDFRRFLQKGRNVKIFVLPHLPVDPGGRGLPVTEEI